MFLFDRSDYYRAFLWILATVALFGNVSSLLVRSLRNVTKTGKSSHTAKAFNLFVSSLSLADCQMGVYLAIVGMADLVFKGSYIWEDVKWKTSITCKVRNTSL